MNNQPYGIGIDVSQLTLDIAIRLIYNDALTDMVQLE